MCVVYVLLHIMSVEYVCIVCIVLYVVYVLLHIMSVELNDL